MIDPQEAAQSPQVISMVDALKTARFARLEYADEYIFDQPELIPSLWGKGERVLWAQGEGALISGQQGSGKTTLAQQIVLARIGVREPSFLGYPVATSDKPVVYLAMDRPRQAARSFRRMVDESLHRPLLHEKLRIWRGPLPIDPTASKTEFADWLEDICQGVGAVVVDSVKDLAPGMADEKVASALNSSWQEVIARDIDLLLLHHERKAASGQKRSLTVDDIFGSVWLTGGLGSIFIIEGNPGDATVRLHHVKQPADPVGPLDLRHEHPIGRTTVVDVLGNLSVFMRPGGATKQEVALALFGRAADADLKKASRLLNKHTKEGYFTKHRGARTSGGAQPDRWELNSLLRSQIEAGSSSLEELLPGLVDAT